jgi:DNA-nicking Smr family endonuclease
MAGRRLDAEERALWARVIATVNPLAGPPKPPVQTGPPPKPGKIAKPEPAVIPKIAEKTIVVPANTLDGGWDRRLTRGVVSPDRSVDLHGHTLASAYAALDRGLDEAIRDGARVLLLVTGKPPRGDGSGRGAIRAAVGGWLAASRHSASIAAVRNAHPRHGGSGALYIILRRPRTGKIS